MAKRGQPAMAGFARILRQVGGCGFAKMAEKFDRGAGAKGYSRRRRFVGALFSRLGGFGGPRGIGSGPASFAGELIRPGSSPKAPSRPSPDRADGAGTAGMGPFPLRLPGRLRRTPTPSKSKRSAFRSPALSPDATIDGAEAWKTVIGPAAEPPRAPAGSKSL
jgi:hypothetical protein